jgi:hypothetical protein
MTLGVPAAREVRSQCPIGPVSTTSLNFPENRGLHLSAASQQTRTFGLEDSELVCTLTPTCEVLLGYR